jgi:hypothetical protein
VEQDGWEEDISDDYSEYDEEHDLGFYPKGHGGPRENDLGYYPAGRKGRPENPTPTETTEFVPKRIASKMWESVSSGARHMVTDVLNPVARGALSALAVVTPIKSLFMDEPIPRNARGTAIEPLFAMRDFWERPEDRRRQAEMDSYDGFKRQFGTFGSDAWLRTPPAPSIPHEQYTNPWELYPKSQWTTTPPQMHADGKYYSKMGNEIKPPEDDKKWRKYYEKKYMQERKERWRLEADRDRARRPIRRNYGLDGDGVQFLGVGGRAQ